MDKDKVSIEEAINRAGFGLYSYLLTSLAGVAIISFACIGYGSTILVPTSACELNTNTSQQGLLAAAPVVGSIIGGVVWGYLADTRGRKNMLIAALIGGGTLNAIASISVNWIMLMVLQFSASLFSSGLFSMAMTLLSECVPMMKRNLVVLLVTSIFLLSQGIMAVLAIPIIPLSFSHYISFLDIYWNSWRLLVVVYSMPSFLTALWLCFMKESPKFVFAKGDEEQALEILKTIHRVNNLGSGKVLEVNGILRDDVKLDVNARSGESPIKELFRMPLLKYLIIMTLLFLFQQIGAFLVWLPTLADQFVSIIQSGEGTYLPLCGVIQSGTVIDPDAVPCALNVTSLLIVLGVGSLTSIVNLILSFIVGSAGRRNLMIGLAVVCGVSGIVVNLIPNAIGSAVMFAVMLQAIVVLGFYTAIILAIFPTHLRALAIAVPLMGGRMGTFASIQILNLLLGNNCEAGFYIYSSLFTSSVVLLSFLPDDRKPPALPALASPLPQARGPESPEADTSKETQDVSQL